METLFSAKSLPLFLFIIGAVIWEYSASPRRIPVLESGDELKVKGGFTYVMNATEEFEIYPFMFQASATGLPGEAGVAGALYYLTPEDLEAAREKYQNRGGCWPSTFSSYRKELLVVGPTSGVESLIDTEGPPPLYGDPQFVRVRGDFLELQGSGELIGLAERVAVSRKGEFFRLRDVFETD